MTLFFTAWALAQGSGGGAKKDYQSLRLSDCEKQLEEFRKENEREPIQDFLPIWGKTLSSRGGPKSDHDRI